MASNAANNSTSNTTQNPTFSGIASLIKLLPTGTMFAFQFLSPVVSNYGECHLANKYLMGALLIVCAFNCAITTFTDSYVDNNGTTQYGIATWKGFWPKSSSNVSNVDWSTYKVTLKDFVHAILGVLVFAVVAVVDANTVKCYIPSWESKRKAALMALPPVVGVVCTSVFARFPCTRHGIGYPPTNNTKGGNATPPSTTVGGNATPPTNNTTGGIATSV